MTTPASDGPDATGHPEVDRALTSLEGLASRPVEEHLDVLVSTHERLHTALDEHRQPDDGVASDLHGSSDGSDTPDGSSGHL